jgi:mono/diheme cytochrome c family protein
VTPLPVPPRAALAAAEGAVLLLLIAHAWLLWRALTARAPADTRPGAGAQSLAPRMALVPLGLAVLFAVPAALLARSGALAPGVSGAGMPWEAVTDATPYAVAAHAGERAYLNRCAPCHLPTGQGLPPAYPPLVGSAALTAPARAHALFALDGSPGVHALYGMHRSMSAVMPGFAGAASDAELSVILTYERATFGGPGVAADSLHAHVHPSDVAAARGDGL